MLTGSIFATGLISGCITKQLYKPGHYNEQVSSILISQDKKVIVVITSKYHYIFEAPEVIIKTLESPFHQSILAEFGAFTVDSDRKTTGGFTLRLSDDANEEEIAQAESVGCRARFPSNAKQYRKNLVEGKLVGQRYDASNIILAEKSLKLNTTYSIHVVEK